MTSAESLLDEDIRAKRGVWSRWQAAPAVTESDIRKWAIAVYWPEPPPARFIDADAAARSRWGGLVAPQEMNPFAWLPPAPRHGPSGRARRDPAPGVKRLLGGYEIEYGEPMRVGDVIRSRRRLEGWQPKAGASGEMLLVTYRHEWQNQRDELVRNATYTLIYQAVS